MTCSQNYLIVHPDTLVSATRIADAVHCARRAVLQEKLRAAAHDSAVLLYGNMLHELFQRTLISERWSDLVWRDHQINSLITSNIESLFAINLDMNAARDAILQKSAGFHAWAQTYIGKFPRPDARLDDPRATAAEDDQGPRIAVAAIHDVEEDIWSARLGIKGKVDASILIRTVEPTTGKVEEGTVPFEMKTGRSIGIMQHRAQTMLYTLLMSERYGSYWTSWR